jgi:membrane protein
MIGFFKNIFNEFSDDNATLLAASIAYFTAFALPSLLVLLVLVLGQLIGEQQVQSMITGRVREFLGAQGARQVQSMIRNANTIGATGSALGFIFGGIALVFSASGAFAALQRSLNIVWGVTPDPEQGGVKNFAMKRLWSLAMVAGVAVILLASLALSGLLAAFGDALAGILPSGMTSVLLRIANEALAFGLLIVLVAGIFKVLPDAEVVWRHVWIGSLFTSALLVAAKFGIGLYIGRGNPGSAFGAASSLAIILLGVFVAGLIVLLGAEFTQVWARRKGERVEPSPHAVRIRTVIVREVEKGKTGDQEAA